MGAICNDLPSYLLNTFSTHAYKNQLINNNMKSYKDNNEFRMLRHPSLKRSSTRASKITFWAVNSFTKTILLITSESIPYRWNILMVILHISI